MVNPRTVGAERKIGPTDFRGIVLALLLAAAVFTVTAWIETEWIARADGFNPRDLGTPIVGRLYSPFASWSWMMRVDVRIDTSDLYLHGVRIMNNPQERQWSRIAFAAERARLPWESGAAFLVFLFGAIAWTRPTITSGLHGAAQWASTNLRRSSLLGNEVGVILGEDPRSKRLLIHTGPQHVLAIGPPGVGKSDGIAIPTLLRSWPMSAIVFDPAGELCERTAAIRAEQTQVIVFDPRDPNTARFNPIAGFSAHDIDAIQTVLASYMLERDLSNIQGTSRFFITSALELGVALVARSIELDKTTLSGAADVYYRGPWKDDDEFCKSLKLSEVPYVKETGSKFSRMHNEVRSSIIATLTHYLALFRLGDVAHAISDSDFDAKMLRQQPTTLYLIVRERDHAALNPLLRMLLTRLLDDLTISEPAKHEQSILLMLDEFPLLKAPIIEQKLATARKHRLLIVLLAQAMTQIREYYGQNESVTGMCDVRIFYQTLDKMTQDFASQTCGDTTHWTESINFDRGRKTRSVHEVGRRLLLPSDLAMLDDRIVVAKNGEKPILAKPIRAHRDKRFLYTSAGSADETEQKAELLALTTPAIAMPQPKAITSSSNHIADFAEP
jgi:type IV secretion system protein VirD4